MSDQPGGWWDNKVSINVLGEGAVHTAAAATASQPQQRRRGDSDARIEGMRALVLAMLPDSVARGGMRTDRRIRALHVRLAAVAWKIARPAIRERTEAEFARVIGVHETTFSKAVRHVEAYMLGAEPAGHAVTVIAGRRRSCKYRKECKNVKTTGADCGKKCRVLPGSSPDEVPRSADTQP